MPLVPADPAVVHPMPGQPRVVLLKPLVTSPLIEVGEFSYYDGPQKVGLHREATSRGVVRRRVRAGRWRGGRPGPWRPEVPWATPGWA
jgi:hypothetical protein